EGDGRDHLPRIGRVELELGALAAAHAVEQHGRSGAQPRDGAVEHHAIGLAHAVIAEIGEPVDEPECRGDDGERERADQHVIGPGFHRTRPFYAAPAAPSAGTGLAAAAAPTAPTDPIARPRCPWK